MKSLHGHRAHQADCLGNPLDELSSVEGCFMHRGTGL